MIVPTNLLQPCDIIFVRDWSPFSWLIRLEEGDFDYSHVCLAGEYGKCLYSTGADKLLWFGCIQDIGSYFSDKKIAVGRYKGLDPVQKAMIIDWCHSQIGKNRYPLFKLIGLMVKGMFGRMVQGSPETAKSLRNTFCAESVALAFNAAGIVLTPKDGVLPDAYTPEVIWNDPNIDIIYRS